jgi:hypothetical protein
LPVGTYQNHTITVTDAAGNASAALQIPDFVIDTIRPTSDITYSPVGPYKQNASVTITATFSVALTVAPEISISGVSTVANVTMTGTGSTSVWTYAYTAPTGDGLETVTVGAGTDAVGNVVTATPTSGATFDVDNTPPAFISASATDNLYKKGDVITITIKWNDAVTVSGTPTLSLDNGGTAFYHEAGSSGELRFVYTVSSLEAVSGDLSASGYSGGAITDSAGNAAATFIYSSLGVVLVDTSTYAYGFGDPHIQPVFGDMFELPTTADCFRMLQGEDLTVNALTRPTTEEERTNMLDFTKAVGRSPLRGLKVDGVFFGKLFIASEGRTLVLDYDTHSCNMSDEQYFAFTPETQNGVCTPYGDKYQKTLGGVYIAKIGFTHLRYGKLEIHATFSSNPWLKHGLAGKFTASAVEESLTGLFIREYQCKSMRVNRLTSQRKKTGILKKNRAKMILQQITV